MQQAWLDIALPQCGYCQPGQILSTVALLKRTRRPSDADIDIDAIEHVCRCGTCGRTPS